MNIENYLSSKGVPYLASPGIGLWRIVPGQCEEGMELSIDFHALVLLTHGSLVLRIHEKDFMVGAQQLGEVINQDGATLTSVSPDAEGWLLFFREDYFFEVFNHHPPTDFAYIDMMHKQKVTDIDARTAHSIDLLMPTLYDTLSYPEHQYLNTLIRLKLSILYFEINEFYRKLSHRSGFRRPNRDRAKDLFSQFIRLVNENSHTERSVEFYARKLCISQQYLARVVKSVTHQTPAQHIEQSVVSQIKTMLADQFTVKQIAAEMNFPDHAALSKYFKRVTGVAPKGDRC